MPDQLEQSLREVLSDRFAQLDPDSLARLQATDYRPRRRRLRTLPAIGALGTTGVAAVIAVVVSLGSTAAPAFAGWQSHPTAAAAGQVAQAAQACGQGLGSPVLTDSRGPYTAFIYANSTTADVCLNGNGVSWSSSDTSATAASVAAGQIELSGGGTRDSAGNGLTVVDGRVGAGVTAVTIDRSDGSSVQATVSDGWYLAWWPGTTSATDAQVSSASGTSTQAFPPAPTSPATPPCPAGGHCASGYGFGSGVATGGSQNTATQMGSSSSSSSSSN